MILQAETNKHVRNNAATVGDALKRVGISPEKHLHWLVHFSALSLDTPGLIPEDRLRRLHLCEDIHALAYLHGWIWSPEDLARQLMPSKDGDDFERGSYFHAGFPTWFKLVRECQKISLNALTSFVDHGFAHLPKIEVQHTVVRSGFQSLATAFDTTDYIAELNAMVRGKPVQRDPLKPIRSLFIDRLRPILLAGRDRLSRCEAPTCRGIYVKMKKGQRYCSDTCRSREGMKRWRKHRSDRLKARKPRIRTKGGHHGTKGRSRSGDR